MQLCCSVSKCLRFIWEVNDNIMYIIYKVLCCIFQSPFRISQDKIHSRNEILFEERLFYQPGWWVNFFGMLNFYAELCINIHQSNALELRLTLLVKVHQQKGLTDWIENLCYSFRSNCWFLCADQVCISSERMCFHCTIMLNRKALILYFEKRQWKKR